MTTDQEVSAEVIAIDISGAEVVEQTERYYVDAEGNNFTILIGAEPQKGFVEVFTLPADGRDVWTGKQWIPFIANTKPKVDQRVDAIVTLLVGKGTITNAEAEMIKDTPVEEVTK